MVGSLKQNCEVGKICELRTQMFTQSPNSYRICREGAANVWSLTAAFFRGNVVTIGGIVSRLTCFLVQPNFILVLNSVTKMGYGVYKSTLFSNLPWKDGSCKAVDLQYINIGFNLISFWQNTVRLKRLSCCLRIDACPVPALNAWNNLYRARLKCVLHKSLPSVRVYKVITSVGVRQRFSSHISLTTIQKQ
jgi:hypothetical protein